MTKHTPGPWTAHPRGKDGAEVRAITSVAWCGIASTHGASGNQTITVDEACANARLIAAAPDLLAACEAFMATTDCRRLCRCVEGQACCRCLARAAIEKARGEDAAVVEDVEDDAEEAEVVSYTLYGTTSGLYRAPDQHVIESRTRVATRDTDSEWWRLRRKSRGAWSRPFSDWDYEELLITGTSVTDEAVALRWVVEGKLR